MLLGDGVGVGEALAVVGEAAGRVPGVVEAEDFGAVGVADFDADAETLGDADLLAEATGSWMMDVAPTEWPADADIVTVSPAAPGEVVSSAVLPAGALAPPPPATPNRTNPATAIPAKPPVSIRPKPLRRSDRRSALACRRSSCSGSSSASRPLEAACEPREPLAVCAASAALAAARASTRVIRGSAAAASSGAGGLACDLARRGTSTFGIRTVVREFSALASSSPLAPQPGQDTAPLRCLRQVLQ